jgi:hypothetical protein
MGGGENLAVRFSAHKSRHCGFMTSTVERVMRQPGPPTPQLKRFGARLANIFSVTESNLQHRM